MSPFRRVAPAAVVALLALACPAGPAPAHAAPAVTGAAAPATAPATELRTAAGHLMKYWLVLPAGWTPDRAWPALVVITDARREFEATARAFAAARGAEPVVIAVPATLTSGGTAQRVKDAYPYDTAGWARAEKDGNCAFDDDGLAAVLADLTRVAHAEPRAALTGLEAAGHVVLAQAFCHPERWSAVYAVAPNWQARCMDDAAWSSDTSRARLPIAILHGERDTAWTALGMSRQGDAAVAAARAHGFANLADRAVPGRGHEFLADVVLADLKARRAVR